MTVFTDNFAILSTQAAFLCGLGLSGLTMVPTWQRPGTSPPGALVFFYGLTCVATGRVLTDMPPAEGRVGGSGIEDARHRRRACRMPASNHSRRLPRAKWNA